MEDQKTLRLITYMSPGIPLDLYRVYQRYLEHVLKCDCYLMTESRWSGPPPGRPNPFTEDAADIGFVCSTSYLKQVEIDHNTHVALLPVAPIGLDDKSERKPVFFSDIIVRKHKADTYRTFEDLKGHRWAYNDEVSLSGNYSVLAHLKKMGTNASFFGHITRSGSHHNSIRMILSGTVDAAAIDSNVLRQWYLDHPSHQEELHTVTSLGPLPIQPIIFNTRLSEHSKNAIVDAFLSMNKSAEWRNQLLQYGICGFQSIDHSLYDEEKVIMELIEDIKDQSIQTVSYG